MPQDRSEGPHSHPVSNLASFPIWFGTTLLKGRACGRSLVVSPNNACDTQRIPFVEVRQSASRVGLVRETASDLVALSWLWRRRRRRYIIDILHHSRREQANVSVELPHPPEFRLSFYERKKSGASNAAAAARKVAVEGRRKEEGRNGKTVLKFPLAATAAAVRLGLSADFIAAAAEATTSTTDRATDRAKEEEA